MTNMEHLKNKLKPFQSQLKNLSTRVFNSQSLILSQSTAYEIIGQIDQTNIRYYAATQRKYLEPLVFVSPLAINMSIYDLYPYRSLIKYFQTFGFDVYLIDWGKLDQKSHNLNFLTFINHYMPYCIDQIRKHSKSDQISLHGWSMAGIFVLLYAADLRPNYIKNLIVLGSPIDSYASGAIGHLYKKINTTLSANPKLQHLIYKGAIPKRLLHTTGLLNAIGFKILDPRGWYQGHKNLILNLDDQKILREHATLSHFLNHMVDYPGGINQDMIFNVWLQNPLKNGSIRLKNKNIQLKNIECSLLIGAGCNDQIVTEASVKPLIHLTNSDDVTFTLISGGHLGLMSSQKSADEFWPTFAQWLDQRSTKYNFN